MELCLRLRFLLHQLRLLRGLRELAIEISDPTPPRRPQPHEDEAEQTQDPAFMPEVGEAPDDDVYGGTTDCVFKHVCLVVSLRNLGVPVPCECDGPLPVSFGNDLLKPFGINMHECASSRLLDGKYVVHDGIEKHFFALILREGLALQSS